MRIADQQAHSRHGKALCSHDRLESAAGLSLPIFDRVERALELSVDPLIGIVTVVRKLHHKAQDEWERPHRLSHLVTPLHTSDIRLRIRVFIDVFRGQV